METDEQLMDSICAAMDGGRESIMDQKKNKTDQDEKQEKKMGIYFLLTLVALGLLFAGINIWSENYYCDYPNCFNKAIDGKGRCELHTLAINGSLIRDDIRHGRMNWDKDKVSASPDSSESHEGTGSSGSTGSYSRSKSHEYSNNSEMYDYDNADDYADDYAEDYAIDEFGDCDSEEAYEYGYDEAYDDWEEEMDE